jgi:hypothetical protein
MIRTAERELERWGEVKSAGAIANMITDGGLRLPGDISGIRRSYSELRTQMEAVVARESMNNGLNALFRNNGIVIPNDVRLSFHVDTQYSVRVTGTDDKNLIRQIEDVLNRNGNAAAIHEHIIFTSMRSPDEKTQLSRSWGFYALSVTIAWHTGYDLRDTSIVDGRVVTADGRDLQDMIERNIRETIVNPIERNALLHGIRMDFQLYVDRGGWERIPDFILRIDFENGHLIDYGLVRGYGPGQNDWLRGLPGWDGEKTWTPLNPPLSELSDAQWQAAMQAGQAEETGKHQGIFIDKNFAATALKRFIRDVLSNLDGQVSWVRRASELSEADRLIAQKLIGENGFFGVRQTTDRIMSFARGMVGDNASAEDIAIMRAAVQEGFDQVARMFGGFHNLPQVTRDTHAAIMREFDAWTAS